MTLMLPLSGPGLNVFYGPNEAGKSTLMRFARAVLYGGTPPRLESDAGPGSDGRVIASGAIRFTPHAKPSSSSNGKGKGGEREERIDDRYTVRATVLADGRNQVQLVGPHETALPADRLSEFLADTPAAIFDRLFAVDLYELQELATL